MMIRPPLRTQGWTNVIVVLGVLVFLSVTLAVSFVVSMRGLKQSSVSGVKQETQFAGESALAIAQTRMNRYIIDLNALSPASGTTQSTLLAQLGQLCGSNLSVQTSIPDAGQQLCTISAPPLSPSQVKIFVNNSTVPTGMSTSQWTAHWQRLFSGSSNALVATSDATMSTKSGTLNAQATGGLTAQSVWVMNDGSYQIRFTSSPVNVTSTLNSDSSVVAQSNFISGQPKNFTITFTQPPYSMYQYFVNRRLTTSGSRLVFWDGDSFEGRVHANGTNGQDAPLFYANSDAGGPRFKGLYTSTAQLEWSDGSPSQKVPISTMFPAGSKFGVPPVPLPPNANNQRLAAAGLTTCAANKKTAECLGNVFGTAATSKNGIYYATGANTASNTGNSFAGGIYVKGDVSNIKLSKNGDFQQIEITQSGTTTVFKQTGATTWTVQAGSGALKTMSNTTFNGMLFVDGAIGTASPAGSGGLGGDGTAAPDIAAATKITVAASGDINIKNDLTYTDNPAANAAALNTLGIYSESGNIEVNGPMSSDITINATMMASSRNHGFGSVGYDTTTRGTPQPKINLTGGIIEEQSQGVGRTSSEKTVTVCDLYSNWRRTCLRSHTEVQTSGGEGYSRNFKWDKRFDDPRFSPPFFPTQSTYTITTDMKQLNIASNLRATTNQ